MSTDPRRDRSLLLLYGAFTISGAAGLIYETIWSRYLALFVGHGAYAQVIVLAIFLGGMSAGALAVSRRTERLRDPLLWYAVAELMAGVIGLLFHQLYVSSTAFAYDRLFPAVGTGWPLTLIKWGLASALILPQSVLLGTTFPFMSAGVLRRTPGHPGQVLSTLYFTNSIGAAVGALLAGFYLIGAVGLPGTMLAAAVSNLFVALITYLVARSAPAPIADPSSSNDAHASASFGTLSSDGLWQLLLGVTFGTAVASFIYEIAWIRMLALVLGSATHAFELMLSAFITGLALGAMWVRRRADQFRDPLHALGTVQCLMGCAALATLPLYAASFDWMTTLLVTFSKTDQGYLAFNAARYAVCLAVMLPATVCAGMTLPLITRILLSAGRGERAIGWVYSVNTLGSIAGVTLASLALLPWLGVKTLLVTGAMVDMALGIVLFAAAPRETRRRLIAPLAGIAAALVAVAGASSVRLDQSVLASGVYRHGQVPKPGELDVLFYRDGRTATVAAYRHVRAHSVSLATNGKPDASLSREWFEAPSPAEARYPLASDSATQVGLPLITLAHAPRARIGAVIGHGSGVSSHLLLASPTLQRLVTIEIEPDMIDGSRAFYPINRRAFEDPRSEFAIDDAKSYFAADPRQRYDLILSEPSNPWVSGVSNLFTTEFYRQLKLQLTPDGVFGQWLHLYELSDQLIFSVLAAVHENFASYQIFQLSSEDVLIVASNRPHMPDADWGVLSLPDVVADLKQFHPLTDRGFEALRLADRSTLAALLDNWRGVNSDFFPILDVGAEHARYVGKGAEVGTLVGDHFDILAALSGRRVGFGTEEVPWTLGQARVSSLAFGARLRRASTTAAAGDVETAHGGFRVWQWQQMLQSPEAPRDWTQWMNETLAVATALHSGTAGVADERFYRSASAYLERHAAPDRVRYALAFMEGLATWDFSAASDAADYLYDDTTTGRYLLPVDLLRDGAVVAKLMVGDIAGARQMFVDLAPQSRRGTHDIRSQLLSAYLAHAAPAPRPSRGCSRPLALRTPTG